MCQNGQKNNVVTAEQRLGISPTNVELYNIIREQIKHEDGLINNRVTWLLTLQGFLFGAYGFSLSAQSNMAGKINDPDTSQIIHFIDKARHLIAYLGLGASLILLLGTGAASLSILNLIKYWTRLRRNGFRVAPSFPRIAGTDIPVFGALAGLLPTYLLPLATATVWRFLAKDSNAILGLYVVYMIAFSGAIIAAIEFFKPRWYRSFRYRILRNLARNRTRFL